MAGATQSIVTLTPEDVADRTRAVRSAIGSLRIEGMEPDAQELEIVDRFARGEIDLAMMHAQMDAYIEAHL
jgi:antitoxin VbhA-like protein